MAVRVRDHGDRRVPISGCLARELADNFPRKGVHEYCHQEVRHEEIVHGKQCDSSDKLRRRKASLAD